MRNELQFATGFGPVPHKTKKQDEISRRHIIDSLLRPLDQTHGVVSEVLAKTGILKLFWFIETIKIKVIPVYARNYVNFNQCVSRAFNRADVADPAQEGAGKRCLAGTEIAIEPDDHAGNQQWRQIPPESQGCCLIRQSQCQCRPIANRAMILAMQEKNSGTKASAADWGTVDFVALVKHIKKWGQELGLAELGMASTDVSTASPKLLRWLELGRHGEMDYMAKHTSLRAQAQTLMPGTLSVISARLPYWPQAAASEQVLANRELGYISRYALGRDYHKTMRKRLQKLAERIHDELEKTGNEKHFSYRVFSDSAPVMEVEFARKSGIAWRGKHTLALTREGSWHFLGELYTSLPLPPDAPISDHCGTCRNCLDACPTAAIVAPYEIDARLCISYLTIELQGDIPVELRPLIGNRIYGCDDCQLCCPWNRFAKLGDPDFAVRNGLDATPLAELFSWDRGQFESRLAGSPIRRLGHERWLRNIAVALGNSAGSPLTLAALNARRDHPSALVRQHVGWALAQSSNERS